MAQRTNVLLYKAQASIDPKYAPVIQRGKLLHEQPSRSTFPTKRTAGDTNIDLWLDGSIYPVDHRTGKRPKFDSLKGLLEFVGDGENGLFGYVHRLHSQSSESMQLECREEIVALREQTHQLQLQIDLQRTQLQDVTFFQNEIRILQSEKSLLEERLSVLQMEVHIGNAEKLASDLELEVVQQNCELERQNLVIGHQLEVQSIKAELLKTKAELNRFVMKFNKLRKTPYGYRLQVRPRRDLSNLKQSGGHAKLQKRLARCLVGSEIARKVQERNANEGRSSRLYGDRESQLASGRLFGSLLSKTEMSAMLETPRMTFVGKKMINYYLDRVGANVGPEKILETCDRNGITCDGYGAIYKTFKGAVQAAGKGIQLGCLPNPYQISKLRREMNENLKDMIGEYYSINDTLVVPGAKSKEPTKVTLSNKNSFFVDVETVQRIMVALYGFTPEELQGDPLIFVLKLDEAEIVHGQKLERVSITIMNRALDLDIPKNSPRYFSVQSEREIWPVASFQVPKESYEVLSWVFAKSTIPNLISAQEDGQLLKVPGIGEFKVQWHLAADMKTIKVMYGLKHGANTLHTCIYCMQERTKPVITTTAQAMLTMSKRSSSWSGGLFSSCIHAKPILGARGRGRWKPILQIPMDRVHICTLHALNRIVEKILHLHFMYVWTIRDKIQQKQAVDEMQAVLSSTGAHGGNVQIFKDNDLSGKSNNVPNKPSLSGASCSKIFKTSPLPGGSDKLWKDIVNSSRNFQDGGTAKRSQMDMWAGLDDLRQYFTKLTLNDNEVHNFKDKAESWGRLFVQCFGEHHVTQYMHVIVRHACWFVNEYGSLAVWSCQGMEKSHHAAKAAYHRHTQHAGGKLRKSPLLQVYEHWYRIIQHRFKNKSLHDSEEFSDLTGDAAIQARRERSISSSAAAHHAAWRETCTRQGSRWVPNCKDLSEDLAVTDQVATNADEHQATTHFDEYEATSTDE